MQLKQGSALQGGKYRIIRTLGQGGFGITYEAEQVNLGRKVAVKEFFMKDFCERDTASGQMTVGTGSQRQLVEKFREKFIREARMIAGLEHPHIVRIHDVFEENGTAYYVMEYMEGGSLADLVKHKGALAEPEAREYICQVSEALAYLHAQNILHFDIKPSNILLNRFGKAVLIDFGISKHYDEAGGQTSSTPVGISKGYAPIEQYQQAEIATFTPATDIYALGATLFFLLTGQTPPGASEDLNRPKGLSNGAWKAIEAAMQPRRKDRPQSVEAFLALLDVPAEEVADDGETEVEENPVYDEKTIAPVVKPDPESVTKPEPKPSPEPAAKQESKPKQMVKPEDAKESSDGPKKPKSWLWILLLAVVAGIIAAVILGGKKGYNEEISSEPVDTSMVVITLPEGPGEVVNPHQTKEAAPSKATTGEEKVHQWVDLGLSVKWATCNVGASSPSDYGKFFAWGETGTKSDYSWGTYKWCNGSYDSQTKYNTDSSYGTVDKKKRLELSDDAASVNWGGKWRMPTKAEFDELLNNCNWSWASQGGKNGYKISSKKNSNYIFLPAAGERDGTDTGFVGSYGNYWSSSLDAGNPYHAWNLHFSSSYRNMFSLYRSNGFSVRPVTE